MLATVKKSDGSATLPDLNFEVTYYARLYAISQGNISSNAGEWSDPIRFPCPIGGYCGGNDNTIAQEYGVSYSEVRAQDGELRASKRDRQSLRITSKLTRPSLSTQDTTKLTGPQTAAT